MFIPVMYVSPFLCIHLGGGVFYLFWKKTLFFQFLPKTGSVFKCMTIFQRIRTSWNLLPRSVTRFKFLKQCLGSKSGLLSSKAGEVRRSCPYKYFLLLPQLSRSLGTLISAGIQHLFCRVQTKRSQHISARLRGCPCSQSTAFGDPRSSPFVFDREFVGPHFGKIRTS